MNKIQKLPLADEFARAVSSGAHQGTVRIGRKYANLHPGPAVFVTDDEQKIIPVTITDVAKKAFSEITVADAKAQNTTEASLKHTLKHRHYAHRRVTDKTPVYVVTIDTAPANADMKAVLAMAERHLSKTSDKAALAHAKINYVPDYHLNAQGQVVGGNHAQLSIGHLRRSASNALAAMFEEALGKEALGITSDRGRFFTLTVQGDMEKIRKCLEREYPALRAAVVPPAPKP